MTEVIKGKWVPVIKPEQMHQLMDTENYCAEQRQAADQVLAKAVAEVEEAKRQAYQETVTKLCQENEQQLQQMEHNLETLLDKMTQDLWHVLYKLLHKFGVFDYKPQAIMELVKQELSDLAQVTLISVSANANTVAELSGFFAQDDVRLKVNHQLIEGECIIETNLYILRINVTSAIEKLTQLFDKSKN
jgi:flagellar biosynthesis/type III secretory pathway protein FliH